jgi:hypothetical protein
VSSHATPLRHFARIALALALAAFAFLLARPGPVELRSRSWEDVLAPLAVGRAVRDYELTAIRRGEEHDVVLTLRRRSDERGAIEVHVLDRGRWSGIRETPSFGVAYETPRSSANVQDCESVTEEIAGIVRANDQGGLGPVDAIPLRSERDPPGISRALDRITGVRGLAVGLCLAAATWLFASGPFGAAIAACWLFAVALLLRAPHLDLPFSHDQDVQRLFTGHLPVGEILTGQGLTDRHPPLYFLVLHVAQLFGQGESVVRFPAVLAGVLCGPALIWSSWALRRRVDIGAMAGLAAVVSVELISRSREVSSIPLFGLLTLMMSASLARYVEEPSRKWTVLVALSHALALWTYYIAVFVILGNLMALLVTRRLSRGTLRAVGIGTAFGSPALVLAVVTFFRDRGARMTADVHPELAWGAHGPQEIARQLASVSVDTFGLPFAALFILAAIWAVVRRETAALLPATAFAATFVGIVLLAPFARVQPYYIVAVIPLVLLTLAVAGSDVGRGRKEPWMAAAALGGVVAAAQIPHLNKGRSQYLPDSDAFMPEVAAAVSSRSERRIAPVAHYDGTLLSYYLARQANIPMDWSRMRQQDDGGFVLEGLGRVVQPLAYSHALDADPESTAEESLRRIMAVEPVLVVSREGFHLEGVSRLLQQCDLITQAGTGKLFRCPGERRR